MEFVIPCQKKNLEGSEEKLPKLVSTPKKLIEIRAKNF